MLHDTRNPYLEWILELRAGHPAVDLTDSGLHTPLTALGPVDPAATEASWWETHERWLAGLAGRYGVPRDEVTESLGGSGAIFQVFAAHQEPDSAVLVEDPTYGPLAAVPEALGFRVDRFPRRAGVGYRLEPERVLDACRPDTRLVAVSDAHNPSGRAAGDEELRYLARELDRRGVTLFVDEVYRDSRDVPAGSARTYGELVVAASSLTKVYGFGSLRAGWVLAPRRTGECMRRLRILQQVVDPWPATAYAAAVLDRFEDLRVSSRERAARGWSRFTDWCREIGHDVPVIDGGISAWFPVPRDTDGSTLAAGLLAAHGVAVVPGRFFGDDRFVRISLGKPAQELDRGLHALARFLDTAPTGTA